MKARNMSYGAEFQHNKTKLQAFQLKRNWAYALHTVNAMAIVYRTVGHQWRLVNSVILCVKGEVDSRYGVDLLGRYIS